MTIFEASEEELRRYVKNMTPEEIKQEHLKVSKMFLQLQRKLLKLSEYSDIIAQTVLNGGTKNDSFQKSFRN